MIIHVKNRIVLMGAVDAYLTDVRTGIITDHVHTENKIVNDGLDLLLQCAWGDSTDYPDEMRIGTGTAATGATDTALGNEVTPVKSFASSVRSSTGISTVKAFWNSNEANGNTIGEAGIFSAAGVMYQRVKLASTLAKTNSKNLTIVWTSTLTDNS